MDNFHTRLNAIVGEDILYTEYSAVMAKVRQLNAEEKTSLLAICISVLEDKQASKNTDIRVSAVRVLVALLPMSLQTITDLLSRFRCQHDYEIHFTLFCYLDWVQEMPNVSDLTPNVLRVMENYLMTVPRKTARAVWMAADMLGSHWSEAEALPLLTRTAQTSQHSVGRQASLLGLEKLLERQSKPASD